MTHAPRREGDPLENDPPTTIPNNSPRPQAGASSFRRPFQIAILLIVAAGLLRTIGRTGWSWPPSIEAISVILLLPAVIIYQAATFFYRRMQRTTDSSSPSPSGDSRKQN